MYLSIDNNMNRLSGKRYAIVIFIIMKFQPLLIWPLSLSGVKYSIIFLEEIYVLTYI